MQNFFADMIIDISSLYNNNLQAFLKKYPNHLLL